MNTKSVQNICKITFAFQNSEIFVVSLYFSILINCVVSYTTHH